MADENEEKPKLPEEPPIRTVEVSLAKKAYVDKKEKEDSKES